MLKTDLLVVGAGQAGLAMSKALMSAGIDHLVVDRASAVAESWRARSPRLKTITPNWMNSLPGQGLDGDKDGFATKGELVDYLTRYSEWLAAPIEFDCAVQGLDKRDKWFIARTSLGPIKARQVVAATGPFQRPFIPSIGTPFQGLQLHSDTFRSADQLPPGRVLVVGSGNSGIQVAEELAAEREVVLSRERDFALPRRLTGMAFESRMRAIGVRDLKVASDLGDLEADIMWWMHRTGMYDLPRSSSLGRRLANGKDPYIGEAIPAVASHSGIKLMRKVVGTSATEVLFDDNSRLRPSSIVWATGYRSDYSWTSGLPVTDGYGCPVQALGVSPLSGFYFLGLRWMRHADSGLLRGVGRDADALVGTIKEFGRRGVSNYC